MPASADFRILESVISFSLLDGYVGSS